MAYLFAAILVVLLLFRFKDTVLLYAPLKLFFNFNVRLGPVTFDFVITAIIVFLFFLKRRDFTSIRKTFPFKRTFVIYGLIYTVTCLIPDFSPNAILQVVFFVLLYSYIYYCCIDNERRLRFAVMSYAVFAIIMCVNGLLQPLMGINPLDNLLQSMSDLKDSRTLFLDNEILRMGRARYRSFIPHAISYGVACVAIFYTLLFAFLQNFFTRKKKILVFAAMCLTLSGVIISASRSPILGLMPLLYLLVKGKIVNVRNVILFLSVLILLFTWQGDYLLYSIQSLFDSNMAKDVQGSSSAMRLRQFAVAFDLFMDSPIYGQGCLFDIRKVNSAIMGAESVWLPLLIFNGMIGVVGYLYFYYGMLKSSKKCPKRIFVVTFTLGWLIMRSATSLIGVNDVQLLTCIFIIYRYFEIKRSRIYAVVNSHTSL